ncbi:uncharacterized protein B0I36DRAFT_365991 [Microdochium trichocladiopsis]|uniref:F-box domain-containing protein n=1 Tax=Microdochium trichocladiopsis TaxID=1682393 RepID=A0A9P9BMM3_9PEZI|nr:uncharacterized protein B0I36DRAFT_365991 [Microdochium trichocladiopsis]KAH7026425.1 hypothetical protein B0I36DRAFT_365991 [Microdochium trichocladiopsis]
MPRGSAMETSPAPARTGSAQLSGIDPALSAAKPPNGANSLPLVDDDESEWEYEYSTTETETYYITLDLSTQDFTDKRTKTIHHGRGGYHSEKQANIFQGRQQSPDASPQPGTRHNSTAVASDDDGEEGTPPAPGSGGNRAAAAAAVLPGLEARGWSSRRDSEGGDDEVDEDDDGNQSGRRGLDEVQIMELHSPNPVIAYQGRVYAGQWHENIGTEFLITRHNEDSHLPVLRHLDDGVDLLAASSTRISVTQKELKRKDPAAKQKHEGMRLAGDGVQRHPSDRADLGVEGRRDHHGVEVEEDDVEAQALLVPPPDAGASQARIDQGNFLREFIALKRARGETDAVPVLTNADHLPKRAPSKRTKTPGRGQGAGGGRPRGVRAARGTTRVLCQFCGVSFGVGRIRTATEPRGAAWHSGGIWRRDTRGWLPGYEDPKRERCFRKRKRDRKRKVRDGEGGGEERQRVKKDREYYVRKAEESGCRLLKRERPPSRDRGRSITDEELQRLYAGAETGPAEDTSGSVHPDNHIEEDKAAATMGQSGLEVGHDDNDSASGEAYVPTEGSDDSDGEPLEYASDAESDVLDPHGSDDDDDDLLPAEDESTWTFSVNGPDPLAMTDSAFEPLSASWAPEKASRGCLDEEEEDDIVSYSKSTEHFMYEHIAGPDCAHDEGYHGDRISVDEMLHSRTAQFLAAKQLVDTYGSTWEPADDDLDFEKGSNCFLTGFATRPPTTYDGTWLLPIRHGVDYINGDNYADFEMQLPEFGLPFHPACFELYRQASRNTLDGRVELDGLLDFYARASSEPQSFPLVWNEDARNSFWQGWTCHVGTEYLVANPVYVPQLASIITAATVVASERPDFSIRDSPFAYRAGNEAVTAAGDLFLKLPAEIVQGIVDLLGSKDIASLRLASQAFQQLPISLWYRLVREELPFLYEAWSDDVQPYPWASRLALDHQAFAEAKAERLADRDHRRRVIQEDMPEIMDELLRNEPGIDDAELELETMCADSRRILDHTPMRLHRETTDWYQLYRDIVVNWDQLKGLRNRERIWQHVTTIVEAIKARAIVRDGDIEMSM